MKNTNKKIICTALATVMAASMFSACDKDGKGRKKSRKNSDESVETKVELSEIKRQAITPDVDPIVNNPRIDHYTEFSLDLLRKDYKGVNTLISPLSVMGALGMTMNGASGETLEEMENTFGMSINDVNNVLYNINEKYLGDEVSQANSIFLNSKKSFSLQDAYRQAIVNYYNSDVVVGEFNSDMIDEINAFVKKNTKDRIDSVIDDLDPMAQVVLVNALAFDGEWESFFEPDNTYDSKFHLENGEDYIVSMMHESCYGNYISGDNELGFIKDYRGNYAFVALLPDEDITIEEYLDSLTSEEIMDYIRNGGNTEGLYNIGVPVFESEYDTSLVPALQQMGMKQAFIEGVADFSAMLELDGQAPDLYISDVIHKSYISVNEEGTEAAAVTAVVMDEACCMEEDPVQVQDIILNRPFVYMIVNTSTDMPVFIGVYNGVEM